MSVESWLKFSSCDSQAMKAREFGARVYCIGVMDFDHSQVGGGGFIFYLLHTVLGKENTLKALILLPIVGCCFWPRFIDTPRPLLLICSCQSKNLQRAEQQAAGRDL